MMLEAESSRLRLPKVKLPEWIRTYAARAWQDRVYLERTVSPLQVISMLDRQGQLSQPLHEGWRELQACLRLP